MKQVNLYEAKTQLSALVDEAAAGGEIIIAKNGKPRCKLIALPGAPKAKRRRIGLWADEFGWQGPDEFPETTPEEIALWEDGPVFPRDEG